MKKIFALISTLFVAAALFAAPHAITSRPAPAPQPAPGKIAPAPAPAPASDYEQREIDHFFREYEQYVRRAERAYRNEDYHQLDSLKHQRRSWEDDYYRIKRYRAFSARDQKYYNELCDRLDRAFRPAPAPRPAPGARPAPAPAPVPRPAPGKAPSPAPARTW